MSQGNSSHRHPTNYKLKISQIDIFEETFTEREKIPINIRRLLTSPQSSI